MQKSLILINNYTVNYYCYNVIQGKIISSLICSAFRRCCLLKSRQMRTLTCMCCVHVELSIPGHRFQSLSGFLPGCDRQRGVSHIHKLSFDPSNLIILIPVDKKRKKNPVGCSRQRNFSSFKLQMIVMMSGGRKTRVPDNGYAITHRFNSDVSPRESSAEQWSLWPKPAPISPQGQSLSLSCFLSGCSQQHNWRLFRVFTPTGRSNLLVKLQLRH